MGEEGRKRDEFLVIRVVLPFSLLAACWVVAVCAVVLTFWVIGH
jgi:hypothetical protein